MRILFEVILFVGLYVIWKIEYAFAFSYITLLVRKIKSGTFGLGFYDMLLQAIRYSYYYYCEEVQITNNFIPRKYTI